MRRAALALALSTHPGPALAVTTVTAALGVGASLEPWRIVLLTVAMLVGQASVGLSNDWIDAERDRAVGRTDKPVARGSISGSTVRTAALVCAAVALALTLPLGAPLFVGHAVFLVSAWLYNAGLKSTAMSVLPYVVSFGLLPSLATLAAADARFAPWWATAVGAALGIAAHFANVLPDLADDRATGVRGLPHRLGARASGILTFSVLAASATLLVIGAPGWASVVGLVLVLALAVDGWRRVLTGPPSRTLFRLIIAAALIDVVVLVVG